METIENILDVTSLPPKEKHPTIFRRFDALEEGKTLTIANDHDPKPLYYQMIGERGPVFNWEYLEAGPEWWLVKITKKKLEASETTVGQLAASDLRKAEVFKKYGIDFCCGGKKTLQEACHEKGLDYFKLEKELRELEFSRAPRASNYDQWPLDFLSDYIVNTHHSYVGNALPELRGYAAKVAEVHGQDHPELLDIRELVEALNTELTEHMMKEERILFPYVRILAEAKKKHIKPNESHFGSVKNPIHVMEMEHESAGQIMREIRELTDDYKLPSEACTSYALLYKLLEEFEDDLHVHIHLENNILFPKAAELEQALR